MSLALHQRSISRKIFSNTTLTELLPALNTLSLRSNQRSQVTRTTKDSKALRLAFQTCFLARSHQSMRVSPACGASACQPKRRITLNHTSLLNTQLRRRWSTLLVIASITRMHHCSSNHGAEAAPRSSSDHESPARGRSDTYWGLSSSIGVGHPAPPFASGKRRCKPSSPCIFPGRSTSR